MKRKLAGFLISAAMVISLLSGCGNEAADNTSAPDKSASESPAEDGGVEDEAQAGESAEPITL